MCWSWGYTLMPQRAPHLTTVTIQRSHETVSRINWHSSVVEEHTQNMGEYVLDYTLGDNIRISRRLTRKMLSECKLQQ